MLLPVINRDVPIFQSGPPSHYYVTPRSIDITVRHAHVLRLHSQFYVVSLPYTSGSQSGRYSPPRGGEKL